MEKQDSEKKQLKKDFLKSLESYRRGIEENRVSLKAIFFFGTWLTFRLHPVPTEETAEIFLPETKWESLRRREDDVTKNNTWIQNNLPDPCHTGMW